MGISGTDWLEVIPIETTMLDVLLSTHSYGNGYYWKILAIITISAKWTSTIGRNPERLYRNIYYWKIYIGASLLLENIEH